MSTPNAMAQSAAESRKAKEEQSDDGHVDDAELRTIKRVLAIIARSEQRKIKEGFSEQNFALGVLNCFLIAFVFGRHPEHLWILYLCEACVLIPLRFFQLCRAKPLNESLYYLDYCWVMNVLGCVSLLLLKIGFLDDDTKNYLRKQMYMLYFGICCGPLMGSNAFLPFVELRFHDLASMLAVFIHLMPPLVVYTVKWHANEVGEAWPKEFHLDYLDEVRYFPEGGPFFLPFTGLDTIAGNSVAAYFAWFIPYVLWMAFFGMDLTRATRRKLSKDGTPVPAQYDTVFHCTLRGGPGVSFGKIWGLSEEEAKRRMRDNDYQLKDFALYMAAHAFLVNLAVLVLGYFCFRHRRVHSGLLIVMVGIAVLRGGKSYTQWASRNGYMVQREFAEAIQKLK